MAKTRSIVDRWNRAAELEFVMGIALALSRGRRRPGMMSSDARFKKVGRWLNSKREERWRMYDDEMRAKGLI